MAACPQALGGVGNGFEQQGPNRRIRRRPACPGKVLDQHQRTSVPATYRVAGVTEADRSLPQAHRAEMVEDEQSSVFSYRNSLAREQTAQGHDCFR